jgi:hypothetical protein
MLDSTQGFGQSFVLASISSVMDKLEKNEQTSKLLNHYEISQIFYHISLDYSTTRCVAIYFIWVNSYLLKRKSQKEPDKSSRTAIGSMAYVSLSGNQYFLWSIFFQGLLIS